MEKPISFEREFPKIMGILNVTPDSFSDGGDFFSKDKAVEQGFKLIEDGADIIDIGGESARPGASAISTEEEMKRTIPVIEAIRRKNKFIPISIDTTKYEVAEAAVDAGANIINDVSGLDVEEKIADLAAEKKLGLILMHMKGTPRTMQKNPRYDDVIEDIFSVLKKKIEKARKRGVVFITADVGIGFGKTVEHNLKLLKYHRRFDKLGVPMMVGLSRKSFIGKILGLDEPKDRDFASALIHSLIINNGFHIIRVHNVGLLSQLKGIYESFKRVSEYE